MIKGIVFDFDGVLVESVDIKTAAFARLFEGEGTDAVDQIIEYHRRNGGISRYDKFRYIYKEILKRKLTDASFKVLCDDFSRLVMEEVIRAPYVAGAKEFLDDKSRRYDYFIVSGTPQEEIDNIIEKRRMTGYFNKVYGSPAKKNDAVKMILKNNKYLPSEIVFIGDSVNDYEAARSNGLRFIARVKDGCDGFDGIECERLPDLTGLGDALDKER